MTEERDVRKIRVILQDDRNLAEWRRELRFTALLKPGLFEAMFGTEEEAARLTPQQRREAEGIVGLSVAPHLQSIVEEAGSARLAILKLRERFDQTSFSHAMTVQDEWNRLQKKEEESMVKYLQRADQLVKDLETAGIKQEK